jgi:hypothetical protein
MELTNSYLLGIPGPSKRFRDSDSSFGYQRLSPLINLSSHRPSPHPETYFNKLFISRYTQACCGASAIHHGNPQKFSYVHATAETSFSVSPRLRSVYYFARREAGTPMLIIIPTLSPVLYVTQLRYPNFYYTLPLPTNLLCLQNAIIKFGDSQRLPPICSEILGFRTLSIVRIFPK